MTHTAVIFDMDGVLLDSVPAHVYAYEHIFALFGIRDFRYGAWAGMNTRSVIEQVLARQDIKLSKDILNGLVTKKRQLVDRAGIQAMIPGALQLITKLYLADVPMAIASSGGVTRVKEFVHRFKLSDHFRYIAVSEGDIRPKPYPDVYIKACDELGVRCKDAVAIEDSIAGVIAAKAAHMHVFGLIGTCNEQELQDVGAVTLASLAEFPH